MTFSYLLAKLSTYLKDPPKLQCLSNWWWYCVTHEVYICIKRPYQGHDALGNRQGYCSCIKYVLCLFPPTLSNEAGCLSLYENIWNNTHGNIAYHGPIIMWLNLNYDSGPNFCNILKLRPWWPGAIITKFMKKD